MVSQIMIYRYFIRVIIYVIYVIYVYIIIAMYTLYIQSYTTHLAMLSF